MKLSGIYRTIMIDYAQKSRRIAEGVAEMLRCGLGKYQYSGSISDVTSMIESAFIRSHQSAEIALKAACIKHSYYRLIYKPVNFKTVLTKSQCRTIVDSRLLQAANLVRNSLQHAAIYGITLTTDDPLEMMKDTLNSVHSVFFSSSRISRRPQSHSCCNPRT